MQTTSARWMILAVATLTMASRGSPAAEPAAEWKPLIAAEGDSKLDGWKAFHEGGAARDDVWKLDADGVLSCRGTPLGYLATETEYANFVLELEWRWPAGGQPGKGGVLIRKSGPDKIWPKSLEAQINAGGAGDFWGLDGYRLQGPAERMKSLEHAQFGQLTNVRASENAERAAGQWNTYRIRAEGETVTLELNGRVVNRATGCEAKPGPILLTSEGTPIEFRKIRLQPLERTRNHETAPSAFLVR
jgi:hypothetical protein